MPTANRILRVLVPALAVSAAGLACAAQPAPTANAPAVARLAIGAEAGTAGFGPVVVFTASKHFTFDLGYTWLGYDYDYSNSDGDYAAKLKLSNIQGRVNWHPFAGTFHLSAGGFLTDNKIDLVGKPKAGGTYEVGDSIYSSNQIGTLLGSAELSKGFAPLVGLGWSKTPGKSGFGFFFDLGLMFIDSPTVTMTATGLNNITDPTTKAKLQADIQKEIRDINDDLADYKYYPVIQLGVLYRF